MHPMQSETSTDAIRGNQFPPTSPTLSPLDAPQEEYLAPDDWVRLADLPLPPPKESAKEDEHACKSWSACSDDGCLVHLDGKTRHGWFPNEGNKTKRSPPRSPSPASELSWTPEEHQPPPPPTSPERKTSGKDRRGGSKGGWPKLKKEKTVRWADQETTDTVQPSRTTTHSASFETKETLKRKVQEMEKEIVRVRRTMEGSTQALQTYRTRTKETMERQHQKIGVLEKELAKERFARKEERERMGWLRDDALRLHRNMREDYYGKKYRG